MKNLKIGHFTQEEDGTGATVFLFDQPSPGAYTLCGSAPASHELHTLELDAIVSPNGLVFLGGSAFGLTAVEGAMRWFKEQGLGYSTSHGFIPIIPAAGIYDLAVKKAIAPTADAVYQACLNASEQNPLQGRVGAGTGASVGKMVPSTHKMSGGFGHAILTLSDGVCVEAYAVVNSLGDVLDSSGNIIAGACLANGEFANCTEYLLSGSVLSDSNQIKDGFNKIKDGSNQMNDSNQVNDAPNQMNDDPNSNQVSDDSNTTLVAVFTNALFTKNELKRISKMAIAGIARAISPAFTSHDGDIIFCFSLGEHQGIAEKRIGTMAAEVVRQAIVNAVKHSILI